MAFLADMLLLLGAALSLFLFLALLAPLEALEWWAGWDQRWASPRTPLPPAAVTAELAAPAIVYLSGVGRLDAAGLSTQERDLLQSLAARLPDALIVRDVFPYSVTNNPLTGRRLLARFWRWLQQFLDRHQRSVLSYLSFLHNMLQVAVCADRRYGPIYSFGVGREVAASLLRHGYQPGSGVPLVLLGYSGGGQVAVGCAPVLRRLLGAPITVVSLGGVLTDDRAILAVEHLYHLWGERDGMQRLGSILFTGRWPLLVASAWNSARAAGRITMIDLGPMTHAGPVSYMSRSAHLADGRPFVEATVAAIARCVAAVR